MKHTFSSCAIKTPTLHAFVVQIAVLQKLGQHLISPLLEVCDGSSNYSSLMKLMQSTTPTRCKSLL